MCIISNKQLCTEPMHAHMCNRMPTDTSGYLRANCYGRTTATVLSLIPSIDAGFSQEFHRVRGLSLSCQGICLFVYLAYNTLVFLGARGALLRPISLLFFFLILPFFWVTGHLALHNDFHTTIFRASRAISELYERDFLQQQQFRHENSVLAKQALT